MVLPSHFGRNCCPPGFTDCLLVGGCDTGHAGISSAEDACREYQSSLEDLTFNSKPHINMLTILVEENLGFAKEIVAIIEAQIRKGGDDHQDPAALSPHHVSVDTFTLSTQAQLKQICSISQCLCCCLFQHDRPPTRQRKTSTSDWIEWTFTSKHSRLNRRNNYSPSL